MQVRVQTFFDPATFTASHLVSDPATKASAIIDPVLDFDPRTATISTGSAERVLQAVRDQGLTLRYVLETHAHADHLSAGDWIRRRTGAPIVIGSHIGKVQKTFIPRFEAFDVEPDGRAFDHLLGDEGELAMGALQVRALHTPGHTPACVTYVIGDAAFVGDTLFMPDYGTARADFPGGDAADLTAPSARSSRCQRRPGSSSATTTCPLAVPNTGGRPRSPITEPTTSICMTA